MSSSGWRCLVVMAWCAAWASGVSGPVRAEEVATSVPGEVAGRDAKEEWFETRVRPVLIAKCLKCHGAEKQSGSLRLDSQAGVMEGGDQGPALVPGKLEESLLIQAVRRGDESLQMPPDEALTKEEVEGLERWVAEGGVWPKKGEGEEQLSGAKHWAFVPVGEPKIPAGAEGESAIDRYLGVKLEESGLSRVGKVDRRTLIRRASFDLIGLPPTPEEVEVFVNDPGEDAWEKLVERLLASPYYGERWGRHWMDVARYADTAGDNADYPIPEIYRYRDYIIRAFNEDKPYDRFVQEQLAGDLLAGEGMSEEEREELIVATGFLALSRRYATAPYELMHLTLEDTIDTVGRGLMGITFRCARCHDHKFDPVTMQDYYGLYSIFASTKYPYAGSEEYQSMNKPREGFVPLASAEEVAKGNEAHQQAIRDKEEFLKKFDEESDWGKQLNENDRERDELNAQLWLAAEGMVEELPKDWEKKLSRYQRDHEKFLKKRGIARKEFEREIKRLKQWGVPETIAAAYAVSEGKVQEVPMQMRGEPAQPGPIAKRQVPGFIAGSKGVEFPSEKSGRLELARWLTSRENPLLARVMVNRVWLEHFGKGLVGTASNFGLRGEAPTHPELLDYLAWRLIEGGWSLKQLHREMLLSEAYQLSSEGGGENAQADPGNRLYWRFDRRRLDAEALRDGMLLVAGQLDLTPPGTHPFPEKMAWNWTQHNPFRESYTSAHRSVYLMTQRLQRHPYLSLFDGPDTNSSVEKRTSATVPLQGLYLLNSPDLQKMGEGFAGLMIGSGSGEGERIKWGYRRAYGREASEEELGRGVAYLAQSREELTKAGVSGEEGVRQSWNSYARLLLISNEFLYVD